jgi:DNA (cytosine-5)-methyltransferase 1
MAEIDSSCRSVLAERFRGAKIVGDVNQIDLLPHVDVVLAGFPCKPYSQAGPTTGLAAGRRHIAQLFRLLDSRPKPPPFVVLENVPFIVYLDNGRALRHILHGLEERHYLWAYRIVDTSAFGLPQRRKRWILVASQVSDAAAILLAQDAQPEARRVTANGFYWTEGNRGIGWADNAIPPLKVGSAWGIAAPPAIWSHASDAIVVPRIRAAERLQGFDEDWTRVEETKDGPGFRERWRMVGNAVSVPLAAWVATRIRLNPSLSVVGDRLEPSSRFPFAAFFDGHRRYGVEVGTHPIAERLQPLMTFLGRQVEPLSARATRGFRLRYERSRLRKRDRFIEALRKHERDLVA